MKCLKMKKVVAVVTVNMEKISCSDINKIVSLQKADLYIDIICITQNKIVKNRKRNNI